MIKLNEDQRYLAAALDYTRLSANTTPDDIRAMCEEAIRYGFAAICINPCWVRFAAPLLENSKVKLVTVIGFPLGATTTEIKVAEAKEALKAGAHEIDVVMNIGHLIGGDLAAVRYELNALVQVAQKHGAVIKIIIETPLLDQQQKITACELVTDSGADFIKTCTGFSGPVSVEDVELLRQYIGDGVQIKASGGITDGDFALDLMDAGAVRIGASAALQLIQQLEAED